MSAQGPDAVGLPETSEGDPGAESVERQPSTPQSPSFPVPPRVAPYHPPPAFPPAGLGSAAGVDSRAASSLALAILGLLFGLPLGLPGLLLGPVAYFLGKSALARIDGAQGALRGHNAAATGWVLGVVATTVGAVVSLFWVIVLLMAISTPA
jgi:hypothetical protein